MYLRFVFAQTSDRHRRRLGVLHDLTARGHHGGEVEEISAWLVRNLAVPPAEAFSGGRALCWFKVDAHACVQKLRDLVFLLEARGERIWQIYSRNPGLITYADENQVVAVPESVRRLPG